MFTKWSLAYYYEYEITSNYKEKGNKKAYVKEKAECFWLYCSMGLVQYVAPFLPATPNGSNYVHGSKAITVSFHLCLYSM